MRITALLISFLCITAFVKAQTKTNNNDYTLVWFDEFNKPGKPDTTKWNFEIGYKRNNEAQWYQPENAVCEKGCLVITGKKEMKPNPTYVEGSNNWKTKWPNVHYTSASVTMKKEHAFMYGKVEVRAKIDAQTGLWPAIWTLGVDGNWPSNGEVDILEYYDNAILANFAYASKQNWNAIWDAKKTPLDSLGGKAWANEFHTWSLIWTENSMQIFVDDILLNDIDVNKTVNKSDGKNPMRQPHFLLLNLALGGDKGGSLANTQLPSKYLIDYVRIYKKN